jgi:hypothetical protein
MTLASTLHRKVRTLRIFESSRGRGDVVPNSSLYWYLPTRTYRYVVNDSCFECVLAESLFVLELNMLIPVPTSILSTMTLTSTSHR